MTECFIQLDYPKAMCRCDNCGHECRADELDMVSDIQERINPGCVVPAGQCPECGALSYLKDAPADTLQGELDRLKNSPTAAIVRAADAVLKEIDKARGLKVDANGILDPMHPICIMAEQVRTALSSRAPMPPLAVVLEGGLVQSVVSTDPRAFGRVIVIDYDTEGAGENELTSVPQSDGAMVDAYVRCESVDLAKIDLHETIKRLKE